MKPPTEDAPGQPGRTQLVCDDAALEETKNTWRSLHHPLKHEGNPVLEPDRPWEGYLVLQPGTVLYDEQDGCFKMWYNAQPSREKPEAGRNLCYATSRDGVHWDKPQLGLVEHDGSTANNILLRGVLWTHCVLKDEDEPEPARRYKLLYWARPQDGPAGIHVAFSRDGVRWEPFGKNPVVPGWATGDTFSVMRDPSSGQYWLYHKTPSEPIRTVSRMLSEDFIHWRHSRRVLAPDAFDPPNTQFYGLSAFPYGGQYLGLLWVYHTYLQSMDVQLVSSRDGVYWERTAGRKLLLHLVPTNNYRGGAFDSKMVYPASAPTQRDARLWIYYSGFTVPHNAPAELHDGRIGVACLRRDGFCSLDATSEGHVLTRPFQLQGTTLFVNAAARGPTQKPSPPGTTGGRIFRGCPEGHGSIAVEIQDPSGQPIPGYSLAECQPITGDNTRAEICWQAQANLAPMQGRDIRLKFVLRNASLYAWQTGKP